MEFEDRLVLEPLDGLVADLKYAALMIESLPHFARQAWLVRIIREAAATIVQERMF